MLRPQRLDPVIMKLYGVKPAVVSQQFIESLATVVRQSPHLFHLDISGMLIGSEGILTIVADGVKHSESLAGFHFADNRVDEWTRMKINRIMISDYTGVKAEAEEEADLQLEAQASP